MIDSTDKERIEECWKVFGTLVPGAATAQMSGPLMSVYLRVRITEEVVTDHRVDGVPTLVLANKQDAEGAMAVEDIKQMFNQLIVGKLNVSEGAVMPISALKG